MKHLLFTLLALAATAPPVCGQLPTEPWFESSLQRPWCAWVQHAGPAPGWTQATVAARLKNLDAGLRADALGIGAWTMATLKLGTPSASAGRAGPQVLKASMGLGWERRRPHVLVRATWGPWTLSAQPTAGQWCAGWRQLQTSGWTFTTQLRQDLAARRSEFVLGLERPDLALYATSLGRWRVVYRRNLLQISLGGGSLLQNTLGIEAPDAPQSAAP